MASIWAGIEAAADAAVAEDAAADEITRWRIAETIAFEAMPADVRAEIAAAIAEEERAA